MSRLMRMLRNFSCFVFVSIAFASHAQMPPVLRDRADVPALIRDGGARVMEVANAPGGMTAYTVEKGGKPLIFYTSPDRGVVFVGVMFDARTGQNLSDAYVERSQKLLAGTEQQVVPQAVAGDAPAASHLGSAAVAGVVEGKDTASRTTYVFFDPRCPYCHKLYQNTRAMAKRGATIKWIPVNTLGDEGLTLSAQMLRRGKEGLDDLANGRMAKGQAISTKERADIETNTALMRAIVQQAGLKMATPSIVFQDKNGKLSVIQDDGSDKVALAAAFGR